MLYHLVHFLLREGENVNAYGLFSFLLFFGFFTGVLIWAFRLKKNYLSHMGDLPLDGGEKKSTDKIQS
jgi:hypothetical protein